MRHSRITDNLQPGTGPLEELAWILARAQVEKDRPWYARHSTNTRLGKKNYFRLKRLLDLLLASLALPFVLIILTVLWVCVRLDSPGQAFSPSCGPAEEAAASGCTSSGQW